MLVPLDPVLDGAAHHHFLLPGKPVRISVPAILVERLQRRRRTELGAPVRLRAVDAAQIKVLNVRILFCGSVRKKGGTVNGKQCR